MVVVVESAVAFGELGVEVVAESVDGFVDAEEAGLAVGGGPPRTLKHSAPFSTIKKPKATRGPTSATPHPHPSRRHQLRPTHVSSAATVEPPGNPSPSPSGPPPFQRRTTSRRWVRPVSCGTARTGP